MSALKEIDKHLGKFREWLKGSGAEVLEPTNEWELLRFAANDITSIIYTNRRGTVTFTGEANTAWSSYRSGGRTGVWRGRPKTKGVVSKPRMRAVIARDGIDCFFCGRPCAEDDRSLEHLVATVHGGPSHVSNLFLAHRQCNSDAGHLSAPEKIAIHVKSRIEIARYVENFFD